VLREIIRLDPNNQRAGQLLVQSAERLAAVAQEAFEAGLVEQAKAYMDEALTVNPKVIEWRIKRDTW
jgi:tetratricopeptide (TPR) repeat protein